MKHYLLSAVTALLAGIIGAAMFGVFFRSSQSASNASSPLLLSRFVPDGPEMQNLRARVATLESEKPKLTEFDSESVTADFFGGFVLSLRLNRKWAEVDTASHAFSTIDTEYGVLFVSCKDAQPYLDGYKLLLEVGNPSGASFGNSTIKTKWGPKHPVFPGTKERPAKAEDVIKYSEAVAKWKQELREKDFPLTQHLAAGSWNPVEIVLSPAKAEDVGHLKLSIEPKTISLRTIPKSP